MIVQWCSPEINRLLHWHQDTMLHKGLQYLNKEIMFILITEPFKIRLENICKSATINLTLPSPSLSCVPQCHRSFKYVNG